VTASIVLLPSLLYDGGGWLQHGHRRFPDSLPFVVALCGLAGLVVNLSGIYWAGCPV
jgi:hypothetical protein